VNVCTEGGQDGIALLCDRNGKILEIVCDTLELDGLGAGRHLTEVVDEGSAEKAHHFLASLREGEAAFDWELNACADDGIITLRFAGVVLANRIWVLAAKTNHGLTQLCEEFALISNEQTNALRAALKEKADLSRTAREADEDRYDEISELNNELVAMQRELNRKNAQLRRLNDQKNELLGMAAHDLRNPLHAILSYSDFLIEDLSDTLSEEHLEFLSIIQSSSEFMAGLVNDLLDVAKIESGKLQLNEEPIDLRDLVERVVSVMRPLAGSKEIEFRPSVEDVPTMRLDRAKIEQVLNNLLSNAVKYSPAGTTVDVRLHQEDSQAVLEVEDRGQGIPEEEREALFQPFQTTSVRGTAGEKSTGLGLVITKRIVEGHGGRIEVESEVGEGSTFRVRLPVEEGSQV
jgi:signal transduction histidine kinase